MSGETEERLTIIAGLKGDKEVDGGLAGIAKELDAVAKNRTSVIKVRTEGSLASVTKDAKDVGSEIEKTSKKSETFASVFKTHASKIASGAGEMVTAVLGIGKAGVVFPAIAIGIQGVIGLLPVLVGGVSLAGIAFAALGGVIGVLALGLTSVTGAIQAGLAAQQAAASSTVSYATRMRAVAEAIIGVTVAQESASRATNDLANAELAFSEAPIVAAEAITQARLDAAHATLSEKEAVVSLAVAQKNLALIQKQVGVATISINKQTDSFTGKIVDVVTKAAAAVTATDLAAAQNQVSAAQLGVQDSALSAEKAQRAYADAQNQGILGSNIYQSALAGLQDAQIAVANSGNKIADAQQAVRDAMMAGGEAARAYNLALSKLDPTAQTFVKYVLSTLIPVFHKIQAAVDHEMLPGIQAGLGVLVKNAAGLESAFGKIGKAVGDSFNSFMQYWGAPNNKSILSNIVDGLTGPKGSITLIAGALTPLSGIFAHLTAATIPLFNSLTTTFTNFLNGIDATLNTSKGQEGLTNFFNGLQKPIEGLFGFITDLGKSLGPLMGNDGGFTKLTDDLRTQFVPAFKDLIKALTTGNNIGSLVAVLASVTEVIAGLVDMNGKTNGSGLMAVLGIIAGTSFITGIGGLIAAVAGITGLGKGVLGLLTGTKPPVTPSTAATTAAETTAGIAGKAGLGILKLGGITGALSQPDTVSNPKTLTNLAQGLKDSNPALYKKLYGNKTPSQAGLQDSKNANSSAADKIGGLPKILDYVAGIFTQKNDPVGDFLKSLFGGDKTKSAVTKPKALLPGETLPGGGGGGRFAPVTARGAAPKDDAGATKKGTDIFAEITKNVIDPLSSFFTKTIPDAFSNAIKGIVTGWGNLVTGVKTLWAGITEGVKTGWEALTTGVKNLWNGVTEGVKTGWRNITSFATTVWTNIGNFASTVFNNVGNFVNSIFRNVGDFANTIWTNIGNYASAIWNNISSFANTVWNNISMAVSRAFSGVTDTISWLFRHVVGGIKDLINGIIGGINGALGTFGVNIPRVAAAGDTVPGSGPYKDKVPYLLAPGEEIISNSNGQADRHRAVLKAISNNTYNGSDRNIAATVAAGKKSVHVDVHMDNKTSVDELSREIAWQVR
jgi:hypothetical protein